LQNLATEVFIANVKFPFVFLKNELEKLPHSSPPCLEFQMWSAYHLNGIIGSFFLENGTAFFAFLEQRLSTLSLGRSTGY